MPTDRGRVRAQLGLHLERLAAEGVWGVAAVEPAPAEPTSPVSTAAATPAPTPAPAPAPTPARRASPEPDLAELAATAASCTACKLCSTRTQVVFGVGNPRARVMFVGEGPGRDEDLQGEPFVGAAGQVLNRIIAAMGLERDAVYIANTVKCRPPQNRNPDPDELAACRHFLLDQVAAIEPEVIVLLGRVAAQAVLEVDAPLGKLRGRFVTWQGIPVMCTYHPAYLLRNPADKRKTWADIQLVMQLLSESA